MNHHAYYLTGERESSIDAALSFCAETLKLSPEGNPDVVVLRYPFFSVDDARSLIDIAGRAPVQSERKVIVIAISRIFHEAQNALLKLFEEPPQGTILILILPSEGVLLPTLRSRLIALPKETNQTYGNSAEVFLVLSEEERRKYFEKLIDQTKSDKDEVKQEARRTLLELMQSLTTYFFTKGEGKKDPLLMKELSTFTSLLHERAAPLKQITEHLLLILPSVKASS